MSAGRPGGARRRLALVLALSAALAPGLAAALPTGWPGAAGSAAAAAVSPAIRVMIDQVAPSVLRPGQDLTVVATLRNEGAAPVENATAGLRLYRMRPASRAELESWVTGEGGAVGARVVSQPGLTIPAGGQVQVQLTLPAARVGLLDQPDVWGPRGLAVEVAGANGRRLGVQRTFALWRPDEALPQVRVSLLAPVTGVAPGASATEPASPADGDALVRAVEAGGRLDALLALAAADRDVELAVDPSLLAAAKAAGARPAQWAAGMSQALTLRSGLALPWGDPDLAAVAHAGAPELLAAAMDLSKSEGLDGAPARTDVLWAPGATADHRTVEAAAAAGARGLVVGVDTLQAADAVTTARVDVATDSGRVGVLVPDRLLTQLFVAPDQVEPGATLATTVQRLLAEIAVLAHDGAPGTHDLLIAPGRDWTPSTQLVTALMSALRAAPWSRVVPVSALLGGADDGAEREPLPQSAASGDELSGDDVRSLATTRADTLAFAAAIDDEGSLTAGLDQQVAAPLSVAWRADPAGRALLVQAVVAHTQSARTGLSLAPAPDLNVISANAPVRFVVQNGLAVPATVSVHVLPRKACLRPVHSDPVTAEPGASSPITVTLVAAANCDVVVDVLLVGADGLSVGQGVQFTARVAPTIEDVGTVVVGALLAIGLLLGIVRTVRRGQSARRGARRAEEDSPPLPVLGGEVPAAHHEGDE